ncbi:MAG: MBOAT family protein [Candidatus Competibacteraceae bacterium]
MAIYYAVPFRVKSYVILIGSYAFYGWWRVDFLVLFFAVTLWTYWFGNAIVGAKTPARSKLYCWIGVAGNLATLGYFKYFNFGVDSFNALLGLTGGPPLTLWQVILPIGISFYIFQAISYLIDLYRKDAPPAARFIDFAAFLSLFPQLIAGPVLRYKDLSDQLASRTHSFELFSEGAQRFMIGFCKKILIADSVAPLVDTAFANPDPTLADAWLGALAYTVQLYFDFSGYSDMAIGLGLMMGFRFIENFNHPYISCSITEFWRRWHISLSTWLRDYLYISLGGNQLGRVRTYINLFLTMLLGGLWHGANWTFVLWGGWHGVLLASERAWGASRQSAVSEVDWFSGDAVVCDPRMGHVSCAGCGDSVRYVCRHDRITRGGAVQRNCLASDRHRVIHAGGGLGSDLHCPLLNPMPRLPEPKRLVPGLAASAVTVICMSFAVLKLASDSYSPFLYFQF